MRKKNEKLQNLPFQVGSRKYRKNTTKLRKRSENGNICDFSVFFLYFGEQPGMGDFVIFSSFFVFPGWRGFSYSVAPRGDRSRGGVWGRM